MDRLEQLLSEREDQVAKGDGHAHVCQLLLAQMGTTTRYGVAAWWQAARARVRLGCQKLRTSRTVRMLLPLLLWLLA